jgi:hypothetical protein
VSQHHVNMHVIAACDRCTRLLMHNWWCCSAHSRVLVCVCVCVRAQFVGLSSSIQRPHCPLKHPPSRPLRSMATTVLPHSPTLSERAASDGMS